MKKKVRKRVDRCLYCWACSCGVLLGIPILAGCINPADSGIFVLCSILLFIIDICVLVYVVSAQNPILARCINPTGHVLFDILPFRGNGWYKWWPPSIYSSVRLKYQIALDYICKFCLHWQGFLYQSSVHKEDLFCSELFWYSIWVHWVWMESRPGRWVETNRSFGQMIGYF